MTVEKNNRSFFTRVSESFSKSLQQAGPYMMASYTLIGAILGLGLLGYYADKRLSTSPFLLLAGLLLGLIVGFYELAKVVFKK